MRRPELRPRTRARLALAGVTALVALSGCGGDETASDPEQAAGSSSDSSEQAPSPSAPSAEAPSSSTPSTGESSGGDLPPRTRPLIELDSPAANASVSDTFTASGRANSPEATVPWEIRDHAGTVVLDGFATAEGWMDRLYPWSAKVDVSSLDPGTYVFVAMTADPSGGEGKPPQQVGTRITVM